jgi:hypothetical protein
MIATSKTQLLATKILPPRCASGLIDRPRLVDLVVQVQNVRGLSGALRPIGAYLAEM